jgi:transposase
MRRPRKMILQLPLVEAVHPNCGCYIKGKTLVVRLGNGERLELPVPERALRWLQEKEQEIAPLKAKRTVRIQWREDRQPEYLKVQVILRVERPRPERPDPKKALLCYVDVNSKYGLVIILATFDEASNKMKILETVKLKPPNRTLRLREAAARDRAAARGRKPNVNWALSRLSKRFNARGWVKAALAHIFKKARSYAGEKPIFINLDIPSPESIKGTYLQKTLISIRKFAKNLSSWYGIYTTFECHSSTRCPFCGTRLKEIRTRRIRIVYCSKCNFIEDRDYTPFYNWIKTLELPLPEYPLRKIELPERKRRRKRRKLLEQ